MKFAILTVSILLAPAASACTQGEARDYAQNLAPACEIVDVSQEKIDWFGGRYFRVQYRCSIETGATRIYRDPHTGKCNIAY